MKRVFISFFIVALLAGCASAPYGNYAQAPATYDQQMATDTVSKMVGIFPPAKTQLNYAHVPVDPFGKSLTAKLRKRGYAVNELLSYDKVKANTASAGKTFYYVVDSLEGTNGADRRFAIKISVGGETLSRLYMVRYNRLTPASAWVHGE